MAYNDWDTFSTTSSLTVTHNTSDPILGNGSLRIWGAGDSGVRALNHTPKTTSSIPYGSVRGQMRMLVTVGSYTDGFHLGWTIMQSQRDVSNAGACYFVTFRHDDGQSIVFRPTIYKCVTTGLQAMGTGNATIIVEGSNTTLNVQTPVAIQIQWEADLSHLGGTHFRLFRGDATDFSDLTQVLDYTHVLNPRLITVAESVATVVQGTEAVLWSGDMLGITLYSYLAP